MPRDRPVSSAPPCKLTYLQESVNVIGPEMLWVFSKRLKLLLHFFFMSTGVAPWGPVTARGKVWHTAYLSLPVQHTRNTRLLLGCFWHLADSLLAAFLPPPNLLRRGHKTQPLSSLIRTQTILLPLSFVFQQGSSRRLLMLFSFCNRIIGFSI